MRSEKDKSRCINKYEEIGNDRGLGDDLVGFPISPRRMMRNETLRERVIQSLWLFFFFDLKNLELRQFFNSLGDCSGVFSF